MSDGEIITTCDMEVSASTLAALREFVYSTEELPDEMEVRVRVVGDDPPMSDRRLTEIRDLADEAIRDRDAAYRTGRATGEELHALDGQAELAQAVLRMLDTQDAPDDASGPTDYGQALTYFRNRPEDLDRLRYGERAGFFAGAHAVTIVRAALAQQPQRFQPGDRVEGRTSRGAGTVTGPAPRGPQGEPAVNVDWDGDAGGPGYEHHLTPAAGTPEWRDVRLLRRWCEFTDGQNPPGPARSLHTRIIRERLDEAPRLPLRAAAVLTEQEGGPPNERYPERTAQEGPPA